MIHPKLLTAILATALLAASAQAAQVNPAPTGIATGVVLSPNGMPAAGVRVYAVPAGDPNTVVTASSAVFESLAQTDASGRYRLEVPAGRYYIAAGSVATPTYYPDVAGIAAAKVITIAARTTTDGINFSKYVPASQNPAGGALFTFLSPPPGSTGVLSGVVQNADGTPAAGVTVVAMSTSPTSVPSTASFFSSGILTVAGPGGGTSISLSNGLRISVSNTLRSVTDSTGRYRINSVPPDTYNIVAGYSDSPNFYPGTGDATMATAITTTPTTMLDTLNFKLLPPPKTTSIRGHVTGIGDTPAPGATLVLTSIINSMTSSFLTIRTYGTKTTGSDGGYEFTDVVPGSYGVQARLSGTSPVFSSVVVADQPVDLDFRFAIAIVSGKILMEDGTPFSDPGLKQVAVTTMSNPNVVATNLLTVGRDGTFSTVLENNTYRMYVPDLPAEYEIRSIKSGTTDLLTDPLWVNGIVPIDVEIRLAKRPDTGTKVSGKVVDAITGTPMPVDRLRICCFDSGPAERISTRVRLDGSFEFPSVPAGMYSAEVQGQTSPVIINPRIEVGTQGKTELTLVSARNSAPIMGEVVDDGGVGLPPGIAVSLTMTSTSSVVFSISGEINTKDGIRIATGQASETLFGNVPSGIRYNVSVSKLPAGYKLKSITYGSTDLLAEPLNVIVLNSHIRITLTRIP